MKYLRPISNHERVKVYRNLRTGKWSVRDKDGRVIAQLNKICLLHVAWVVGKAGSRTAKSVKQRNVHAFAWGTYIEPEFLHKEANGTRLSINEVTYNPFKNETFVYKDNNEEITYSSFAVLWKRAMAVEYEF